MNVISNAAQQRVNLENAAVQALELARASSDAAEVSVVKTIGINVSSRYGQVENVEFNNDRSLVITVYCNHRKGQASSTNLNQQAISRTVSAALDIAHYTSFDSCSSLPEKSLLAFKVLDLNLFHPIELNTQHGISLAAEAEQIALSSDKRIVHSEGGNFNSHFSTRVFGNSYGMLQSYNSSQYALSCSVVAESNGKMERNYSYTIGRSFDDLSSPQWVGEDCARRTLERLNSQKLSTTKAPVLFTAEVAISLFRHLIKAISGNNVYLKSTFLMDYLGRRILPSWLSIKEHPHVPKGLGSSPFDYEGVKTCDRTIVKNGTLCTWLLDNYYACKLNLKSTGHSGGIYNWYITHQNIDFIELIKKMDYGLIVTELMGQGVNNITGDYSRGVSGFWVKNKEIQYPVSEVTIAGNLKDMLLNIDCIANDTEVRSNIRCGSVLLPEMKIAGK